MWFLRGGPQFFLPWSARDPYPRDRSQISGASVELSPPARVRTRHLSARGVGPPLAAAVPVDGLSSRAAPEAGKRHKVLLFIPHLDQGGAERQILALCERLPPRFETVLCLGDDRIHYRNALPTQRRRVLGCKKLGPRALAKLVAVLNEERPDILHCYRDKANFWGRLAARRAPVPVVLSSVRNRMMGPLYWATERFLSRRTDRVLTNSRGVVPELVGMAGVDPAKIQVVHNFIDLETFQVPRDEQRAEARARFGLGPEELALLVPARISLQKHQLGLVKALGLLRRKGRLPAGVRVLIAGRSHGRVLPSLLRRLAAWYGILPHLRFMGPVEDMSALYHAADALVLPSLFEGLPNVVLEAQASGLPAVVSHAANLDRIVVPGESGFEFRTGDSAALAEALGELFATNADERRAMGRRGREHVGATFSPARILEETVALYDGLLASKGLGNPTPTVR